MFATDLETIPADDIPDYLLSLGRVPEDHLQEIALILRRRRVCIAYNEWERLSPSKGYVYYYLSMTIGYSA